MEELLNPQQVAKILSVKPITVYKWVEKDLISCYRLGRCIRFKPEDVERFLEERRIEKN
jgi:excisionase family DNA binding protein